ncbi:diaminopimelate decarboxylase [Halobacteriovorax sp. JY17]|uniref:diaminopimelate decarboxylase n=1 Tax=Halobacteriovorax sp. JY17 TaxID=2014617 RepID=UPI000C4D41DC|nr:diaminopimelate decarboxylase [Halobacteriovorax sp. JY17]PIK16109.1 MAG: diaminopimelate decarboxylase [Halobacteriovorax sp. JY17]
MNIKSHLSLSYKKNKLFIDDHCINSITKDLKTPFYLYSVKALESNYLNFYLAASNNGLSNPLVCYALKANPNLSLLKSLKVLGAGADIVSGGELKQALKAKIPASKIVFSGVGKTEDEIRLALKCHRDGIYSFNVESIEELEMIGTVAQSLNKKARVALRLNPQVNVKTHKHISTGGKSHKFGILKVDIEKSLKKKSLWKNIDLVGLSMHIGSQLTCLKATEKALKEIVKLASALPSPLEFIDVGGGLGVPYNEDHPLSSLEEYMSLVAKTLKSNMKVIPRVVFEPGRFIVANCGVLVTEVIRIKKSEENKFIIVDGGMNDFVRSSLYGAYHHVLPLSKRSGNPSPCHVVGPICETADSFASNRSLPPIKSRDRICIGDVGAYGHSMSSTYNMRERTKEYILDVDGNLKTN